MVNRAAKKRRPFPYGTAHSFLVAGGPQFAASLQIGEHLVIGVGVHIPFGGGALRFDRTERFANSMYPGAADGSPAGTVTRLE